MRECSEEAAASNSWWVSLHTAVEEKRAQIILICCSTGLGDRIVVVVQKQRNFGPESSTSTGIANKVRRGDIRHAVVVRAAKEMQRPDGSIVKFDDNACVLVNKTGDPIGTRMNG